MGIGITFGNFAAAYDLNPAKRRYELPLKVEEPIEIQPSGSKSNSEESIYKGRENKNIPLSSDGKVLGVQVTPKFDYSTLEFII